MCISKMLEGTGEDLETQQTRPCRTMGLGAGSPDASSHLGFDFLSFFSALGFFCTGFFVSLPLLTPKSSSLSSLSSKSGSLSESSPKTENYTFFLGFKTKHETSVMSSAMAPRSLNTLRMSYLRESMVPDLKRQLSWPNTSQQPFITSTLPSPLWGFTF